MEADGGGLGEKEGNGGGVVGIWVGGVDSEVLLEAGDGGVFLGLEREGKD